MCIRAIYSGQSTFYTYLCQCDICACFSETEENAFSLVRRDLSIQMDLQQSGPLERVVKNSAYNTENDSLRS